MKRNLLLSSIIAILTMIPFNFRAASVPASDIEAENLRHLENLRQFIKQTTESRFISLNGKKYREETTRNMGNNFEIIKLYEEKDEEKEEKMADEIGIIGLTLNCPAPQVATITGLIVQPNFRGQGLKSYLLKEGHARLANHGIKTAILEPVPPAERILGAKIARLPQLRRFYESRGYKYSDSLSLDGEEWMERNISLPAFINTSNFAQTNKLPGRLKNHEGCRYLCD